MDFNYSGKWFDSKGIKLAMGKWDGHGSYAKSQQTLNSDCKRKLCLLSLLKYIKGCSTYGIVECSHHRLEQLV